MINVRDDSSGYDTNLFSIVLCIITYFIFYMKTNSFTKKMKEINYKFLKDLSFLMHILR